MDKGAVQSLEQVGVGQLEATVKGSDVHPYVVEIGFDDDGVTRVECTCQYRKGTWCKHIAATLLEAIELDTIPSTERAAVADLVQSLDRDDLVRLLQQLVERDPAVANQIEQALRRGTE